MPTLNWIGKEAVVNHHLQVPFHLLKVPNLGAKLKYWDYKKVLEVHDALEMVNESINSLGLVPQGF